MKTGNSGKIISEPTSANRLVTPRARTAAGSLRGTAVGATVTSLMWFDRAEHTVPREWARTEEVRGGRNLSMRELHDRKRDP